MLLFHQIAGGPIKRFGDSTNSGGEAFSIELAIVVHRIRLFFGIQPHRHLHGLACSLGVGDDVGDFHARREAEALFDTLLGDAHLSHAVRPAVIFSKIDVVHGFHRRPDHPALASLGEHHVLNRDLVRPQCLDALAGIIDQRIAFVGQCVSEDFFHRRREVREGIRALRLVASDQHFMGWPHDLADVAFLCSVAEEDGQPRSNSSTADSLL